jgi:hypothetical protein
MAFPEAIRCGLLKSGKAIIRTVELNSACEEQFMISNITAGAGVHLTERAEPDFGIQQLVNITVCPDEPGHFESYMRIETTDTQGHRQFIGVPIVGYTYQEAKSYELPWDSHIVRQLKSDETTGETTLR